MACEVGCSVFGRVGRQLGLWVFLDAGFGPGYFRFDVCGSGLCRYFATRVWRRTEYGVLVSLLVAVIGYSTVWIPLWLSIYLLVYLPTYLT